MQARQSLPVVLVVLSILAPVAASSAETPRAYLIEMNLTATAPNGSEQILSCPRVMVLDGYEACGDFGGTLAPPAGVKVQEPLQSGSHYRVKVLPNHGQLFVDATLNKSSGQTDADGVSIATLGATAS